MTIYNAKDFGRVIRARRKEKGLTQERLSLYTNCSTRYISELERGKETAELGKALLICNT
jgi:transcriptional regulator with XRE-family HTH domain